jgi:hypothetical protein
MVVRERHALHLGVARVEDEVGQLPRVGDALLYRLHERLQLLERPLAQESLVRRLHVARRLAPAAADERGVSRQTLVETRAARAPPRLTSRRFVAWRADRPQRLIADSVCPGHLSHTSPSRLGVRVEIKRSC